MKKIPSYVKDILSRSAETFGEDTLTVKKSTPRTLIPTFRSELDHFAAWCRRNGGTCEIVSFPTRTTYSDQTARIRCSLTPELTTYLSWHPVRIRFYPASGIYYVYLRDGTCYRTTVRPFELKSMRPGGIDHKGVESYEMED